MTRPRYTRTPGKDGRYFYKPTIKISPEERAFFASEQAKVADGTFPYHLKSLSYALRTEVRESRSWLNSALRHADGKDVKTTTSEGRTATEAYSVPRFRAIAAEVDDLLARCQAASPKHSPKPSPDAN